MKLTLELQPEQLRELAKLVAAEMGHVSSRNPLTIAQFAKAIKKSWPYVKSRVEAGIILKLDQPGDTLIPYSELDRYRNGGRPS